MNVSAIAEQPLTKARRDLSDANDALAAYWGRSSSDTDNQMADVRSAVEALTRAVASVLLAVERVSNETAGLLLREAMTIDTERIAEIVEELTVARAMVLAGNSETAIAARIDRALELLSTRPD